MAELLVLEGVWKGYSRGGQWSGVLAGVSLSVESREVVAVVGSRLAGKTTVLRLAAGQEQPDRGVVVLDGRVLEEMSARARSELLGSEVVWVDGKGPALDMEVTRFVGWPLAFQGHGRRGVARFFGWLAAFRRRRARGRRAAESVAWGLLEQVGAKECGGRKWAELSNWQRVRVELARALAGNPRLVVIDDLLDGLGPRGTEEAADLLRSLIEAPEHRCGVLISVSDMDSAIYADRIWSLSGHGTMQALAGLRPDEPQVLQFPAEGKRARRA